MAYAFYRNTPNACIIWTSTGPTTNTVTIPSKYYPIDHTPPYPFLLPPKPLVVRVNQTNNLPFITYDITFLLNNVELSDVVVTMNFTTQPTVYTVQGDGLELGFISIRIFPFTEGFDFPIDAFVIELTLNSGNLPPNMPSGSVDNGDKYSIIVNATCQSTPLIQGVNITFGRFMGANTAPTSPTDRNPITSQDRGIATSLILSSNLSSNLINIGCGCHGGSNGNTGATGTVRIPIIDILGQLTVEGDYLSDFKWTIQDKYQYCDNKPLCLQKSSYCENIFLKVNKLKTTTYFQYGPPMQDVVKGKGKTLRDKLEDFYLENQIKLGPSFMDFYIRMLVYGMLKYVLARILYGDFNMKYLCRNYNKKFFKDLAHSRFCGFIDYFEDPENGLIGFQHYFIKC